MSIFALATNVFHSIGLHEKHLRRQNVDFPLRISPHKANNHVVTVRTFTF